MEMAYTKVAKIAKDGKEKAPEKSEAGFAADALASFAVLG
jgi:hypothetical protein